MNDDTPVRPAYDPELASSLLASGPPRVLDFDPAALALMQAQILKNAVLARSELEAHGLVVADLEATADDGHPVLLHHVYSPTSSAPRPCILYVHGGGMVLGNPWDSVVDVRRWVDDFGVSVVVVDYRLAPRYKAPTPIEDCYAALLHVHGNAGSLGIDPRAIVLAGLSAGGALAAATAVLARERGGPILRGQMLLAPMLDPKAEGDSIRQLPEGPWNREENDRAWQSLLATDAHSADAGAFPSAVWLGDLPPTLLEVGSADILRSEVLDYASRIWRVGGNAELHVWSGGFHGFGAYPHAAVTQAAIESRRSWLARLFGYGPQEVAHHEGSPGATGAAG